VRHDAHRALICCIGVDRDTLDAGLRLQIFRAPA
jgi:hypothetical protein